MLGITLEPELFPKRACLMGRLALEQDTERQVALHPSLVHVEPIDDFALGKRDRLSVFHGRDQLWRVVDTTRELAAALFEMRNPEVLGLVVVGDRNLDSEVCCRPAWLACQREK